MNIKNILLGGALLALLLFSLSCVSAADDNSQLENYNNNSSLNIGSDNADVMEFNNTHDKIVIENVEKNKVIITNSSPSLLDIEKSKLNLVIIYGTNITLPWYKPWYKNSNIIQSTIDTVIVENSDSDILSIKDNSHINTLYIRNSKFAEICIEDSNINTVIVENSTIHTLKIINSFFGSGSEIENLITINSLIKYSIIKNSSIENSTIENSTFYRLDIVYSFFGSGSEIENSNIKDSNIKDLNIACSTIKHSNIEHSIINKLYIKYSTIENLFIETLEFCNFLKGFSKQSKSLK